MNRPDRLLDSPEYQACRNQLDLLNNLVIKNETDALNAIRELLRLEETMTALKPLIADPAVQANSNPMHILNLIVDSKDATRKIIESLPGFNPDIHGKAMDKLDEQFMRPQTFDGSMLEIKEDIKFKFKQLNYDKNYKSNNIL